MGFTKSQKNKKVSGKDQKLKIKCDDIPKVAYHKFFIFGLV